MSFVQSIAHRRQLANGLTVLTREDHSVPIVTSMIWYKVGTRHEQSGCTGISHFLEHMMFKGTDRFKKGEIDRLTTRRGGFNNAFTSLDYTAYYFSFASDRWWDGLEIEADRITNAILDPEEFELERQVILEELRMDLDSPWGALRRAVDLESFSRHPYRFPIVGLEEDLSALTLEQLARHYQTYYSPNNATVVVVGDFETAAVMARIEALFGALKSSPSPVPSLPLEPLRSKLSRISLSHSTHVPRLLLSMPSPSIHQRQHLCLRLLDKILTEGKLGRIYRRLVEEERIASFVDSEAVETYDPYLFVIRLELHEKADLEKAEDLLFKELEELVRKPLKKDELDRAKNQCLTEFLSEFETTFDQAFQIGLHEVLGCGAQLVNLIEEIAGLTAEELQEAARSMFVRNRAVLGVVLPSRSAQ